MLVVDDRRDHHVADVGVERRRLAEHVDAAQAIGLLGDLAQDVVGGQPERILDVDDHRVGRGQVADAQPRVERRRVEPAQVDDLGRDAQRGRAREVGDADRALLARALLEDVRVLRVRAEVLARGEVEEVLPRALGLAGAEALELGQEVGVLERSTHSTISFSRSRAVPVSRLTIECGLEETK